MDRSSAPFRRVTVSFSFGSRTRFASCYGELFKVAPDGLEARDGGITPSLRC